MIFAAPLLSGAVAGELTLTLEEAIAIARLKSVDAAVALDELKTAYWEWRTFRADQLPEVSYGQRTARGHAECETDRR